MGRPIIMGNQDQYLVCSTRCAHLRDRARHRALDEKGGYATTWVARRSHTPFGVPAGKFFDGFNADITALDSMLFELRKLRIARQVYGDGDEQAVPIGGGKRTWATR